jgi:REP element-mobilizing transposase RayT
MRARRLKAPASDPVAYYHCMSEVVNGDYLFGPIEREQFVKYLREYEFFCGVRVLTYCILSNHFHVLVEIPARPAIPLTAEELLARVSALTSTALKPEAIRRQIDLFRSLGDTQGEREFIDRHCVCMWDVSGFLQRLKQRFSQWFNQSRGRDGTLWKERFKSVLVEDGSDGLAAVAAYVDLNPVRAGMVQDPKDYRWSGYGAAAAGEDQARAGLRGVMALRDRVPEDRFDLSEGLAMYRMWIFSQGEQREGTTETGEPLRKGIPKEQVLKIIEEQGRVSLEDYLKLRVRYFADGAVLGSREYVERIFTALRERFGPKRTDGARRMEGLDRELYVIRDLRKRVFG